MPASAVVDIRDTYGALQIGLIVSAILYGVTIAQTYYRNRDRKVLQGFVAFLFSLDTLHTILCIYSVYWYLVLNFGNAENLDLDMWAVDSQTEINTFVGLLVQLSVPSSVLLLASCPNVEQLLCETIVSHKQQHRLPGDYLGYMRRNGLSVIGGYYNRSVDVLVSLAQKDGYQFRSVDEFVVRPTSLIYMAFFWMMCKCYVNSFLAISVPTAVAVTVHTTATTDFGFANDDYDQEANTGQVEKLDVLVLLSEQVNPDAPRVLVAAIEACVDSTGQGLAPPPTATLVNAFIRWYADSATRPVAARHLWVQLFARAQGQYIFPNSSDYPGKRPLSDARLCAWWRRVIGQVGGEVREVIGAEGRVDMYYVLPGHNELEAQQWTYGHPYCQTNIPLPCPPPEGLHNLGHYIPSFEDDPKNRFMDEIAFTDTPVSPRKRARTSAPRFDGNESAPRDGDKDKDRKGRAMGELNKVQPDEFWERMSFRQECVAGAVTGFFATGISVPEDRIPSPRPPPLSPQPGQVPRSMNRRILSTLLTGVEFSMPERARKATDLIEGTVRGLCEGLAPQLPIPKSKHQSAEAKQDHSVPPLPRTPPRRTTGLPPVDDISPNPFGEPEATLEIYKAHIYGSISVRNPPLPLKAVANGRTVQAASDGNSGNKATVHILTVSKKKKRADT
ncbi:histone acetylation protein-domain-containing protein [Russula brevipes]|nr:histone acetylation protein-domain-containing protein [Russula brevipes]